MYIRADKLTRDQIAELDSQGTVEHRGEVLQFWRQDAGGMPWLRTVPMVRGVLDDEGFIEAIDNDEDDAFTWADVEWIFDNDE